MERRYALLLALTTIAFGLLSTRSIGKVGYATSAIDYLPTTGESGFHEEHAKIWTSVLSNFNSHSSKLVGNFVVIPPYRLLILLPRGKIGSTSVKHSIFSFLCSAFHDKPIQPEDWDEALKGFLLAANIANCVSDIEKKGIVHSAVDLRFDDIREYSIFLLMRDPLARYISILNSVLGFGASKSIVYDQMLSSVVDPICHMCKSEKAHSVHWLPQYQAVMESGLARIDHILCTEELDFLLPRMSLYINEQMGIVDSHKTWTTLLNATLHLPPMNLTRGENITHSRRSEHLFTVEDILKVEQVGTKGLGTSITKQQVHEFRDNLGFVHQIPRSVATLYLGDIKINPCGARRVYHSLKN